LRLWHQARPAPHVAYGLTEGPGEERRDDQNANELEPDGLANTVRGAAHEKGPIVGRAVPHTESALNNWQASDFIDKWVDFVGPQVQDLVLSW
jgi:hypothetical protein